MKLSRVARELGVDIVLDVSEPEWYSRLTIAFRRSWRRELATVAGVFALGAVIGFWLGGVL